MTRLAGASLCAMLLAACSSAGTNSNAFAPLPPSSQNAVATGPLLYTYSTAGTGLVAAYRPQQGGPVVPQSVLAGSKTGLAGGAGYFFAGGVQIAADGTLYVFDGMKAKLLAFAPLGGGVAKGNVAPVRVEHLPPNSNGSLHIPQYAGFAEDTKGDFWTVDRSNGKLVEFPMGASGKVQPIAELQPKIANSNGVGEGVASTVSDDGHGNIFCSCESHDLALESFGVTEYAVSGAKPRFVRSFYGILGNLDNQIPSEVLHVDPVTQTIYLGLYKPAAVIAYPVNTPTGHAPPPRIIGGPHTTLASTVAAISTDSAGRIYVAIDSTVAVFPGNASGDVTPLRVLTDSANMQYLQYTFGSMLAFH